MALEAWAHEKIEAGDDITAVLKDVLGPNGSAAAYLLVAVDVLISHWPATRDLLVPFVSSPELLAIERQRAIHDEIIGNRLDIGDEPKGRVRLADLQARPSRGVALEQLLFGYLDDDAASRRVRVVLDEAVARLGPYDERADFGDPAFMGAHARSVVDPVNWVPVEGGRAYRPPRTEADHLTRMAGAHSEHVKVTDIEARISLATNDFVRGSAGVAREAATYAQGELPDESESDYERMRSLRLVSTALLVARDGDDALLVEQEAWVREVISRTLAEKADRFGARGMLAYNRHALPRSRLSTSGDAREERRTGTSYSHWRAATIAPPPRPSRLHTASSIRSMLESSSRLFGSASRSADRAGIDGTRARIRPETYERGKRAEDQVAVSAESAWLDGGQEPAWPTFPNEEPTPRMGSKIRLPGGIDEEKPQPTRRKPIATKAHRNGDSHRHEPAVRRACKPDRVSSGSIIRRRMRDADPRRRRMVFQRPNRSPARPVAL
jgi:hypothetical protein